jgi:uroporphyrinogen decarboxylase
MKGRERALRALRGENVDRTPIYSHFRNPAAIEKVTGLDFKADPFRATAAAYRALEIDMTKEISVPFTHAPDGWVVNSTTYGVNRVKPETADLVEFVRAASDLPDLEQIRVDYDFDRKVLDLKEWFDRQQNAVGDSTLITGQMGGCFDPCLERYGYETFLSALILEPGAAEAGIRYHASLRRLHSEAFVESGCSEYIMYCDDIAGLNGTLVHPDLLSRYWLPHMLWAVEPLINAGIFVIYHSDGNIRSLLDVLSEAGFKGLHPLEPKSDMDAPDIKKSWGDKFLLFGGLCQVSILPFGSEEEVRAEVRRLLDGAADGGGFFIGSSGMCGPDIPLENAIGWINEASEYGKRYGSV